MTTAARRFGLGTALAAIALAAACGTSTGPATGRNNPGTGSSTLRVTADIDGNDDPASVGGFSTDYFVSVRTGGGLPVSGAIVTINNFRLGKITLPETGSGTGDYQVIGNTFPSGDFTLDVVKGSDNVHDVVVAGPSVHTITTPVKNATVAANQPLLVRWTVPSRAQSAEVESRDFGITTVPDTGAYSIAFNPPRPDQRVRVWRFTEVDIAGGLPGSRLRVSVRKTVEPVIVQ